MDTPDEIKLSEASDFLSEIGHANEHLMASSMALVGVMQMKESDSWRFPIEQPQSAQDVTAWLREHLRHRLSTVEAMEVALQRLVSMGVLLVRGRGSNGVTYSPSEETRSQLALREREVGRISEYANPESQSIIRMLIAGTHEQRSELLRDISKLPEQKRTSIARHLRNALTDSELIPTFLRDRSPSWSALEVARARSWLVSALVYADHQGRESGQLVRTHARVESEPEPVVRFWALASLYRCHSATVVSLAREVSEDPEPAIRYLSAAIRASRSGEIPAGFKDRLEKSSPDRILALRALEIVPLPELAPVVLRIALDGPPDANDTRIALSVICDRTVAEKIARAVRNTIDEQRLVERILQACVDSSRKDILHFRNMLQKIPEDLIERFVIAEENRELMSSLIDSAELLGIDLGRLRSRPDEKTDNAAKPSSHKLTNEATPTPNGDSDGHAQGPEISGADVDPRWKHRRSFSAGISDRARRADDQKIPDQLQVGTYASHLAYLIAARETALPLSIGLFGRWGSGKSHLMDLIQEQIADISDNASPEFHTHIIQVRFNAWHYLDTNLWASLVSEIFEQLFAKLEHVPNAGEKLRHLKEKLKDSSALTLEAKEAHDRAKDERVKAEAALEETRKKVAEAKGAVRSLGLDDLTALLKQDPTIQATIERVRDQLGIPALASSLQELNARHTDMMTFRGRALGVLASLGSGWRLVLTVTVIAAAAAVSYGIGIFGSWVDADGKPYVDTVTRVISQLTTVVIAVAGGIAWFVRRGNVLFNSIDQAHRTIMDARAKRSQDTTVVAAQGHLDAAHEQEKLAEQSLREAHKRESTIAAEISELAPGRQLIRFLKDRTQGDDYSKHLGLVSIVRKDFKELSDLLMPENGHRDASLPSVDRIVLYIDDLDRCRSDRVIQVLEAVHLLLAFPLFAVVVAVDPRWLRQSLVTQYADMMDVRRESSVMQHIQAATPQDYLEKIFQVPFQVQEMLPEGYRALVDDVFCIDPNRARLFRPLGANSNSPQDDDVATQLTVPLDPQSIPSADPASATPSQPSNPAPTVKIPKLSEAGIAARDQLLRASPTHIHPEQMVLTEWERADVHLFQPLFSTPRSVKRFANVYALIRVSVLAEAWDAFLGRHEKPGDYRIPMAMVAITAAFPSLSEAYLTWLSHPEGETWSLGDADIETLSRMYPGLPRGEVLALREGLARIDFSNWPLPETRLLLPWIPRVRRYSF